jgi:F-type H+-transporting ATPase subunit delta
VRSDALARRYAEALLDNCPDPGTMDAVQEELLAVARLGQDNEMLRNYLLDPSVSEQERRGLLHRILEERIQPVLMHFLDLVLHKHRLDHLDAIAAAFTELVEEQRNQARVKVVTAVPLPEDQADRLKRALDTATGKDCILVTKIEPAVIGGAVAEYGDKVLDGSIRTALDELRKQLLSARL